MKARYLCIIEFLLIVFISACTKKNDDFLALKNDFEDIFMEYRNTNFSYTKEELIKLREDMVRILKKEGEKW